MLLGYVERNFGARCGDEGGALGGSSSLSCCVTVQLFPGRYVAKAASQWDLTLEFSGGAWLATLQAKSGAGPRRPSCRGADRELAKCN